MRKIGLILIAIITGLSFAQNAVIDTQSIVVNPKPSFTAEVWVNKDPSGQAIPKYLIGENIVIGVRVSDAAYIYLFDVRSNGEIAQILPNRYDQEGLNNFLNAGEVKYFPASDAPYTFTVDGPPGIDKLIVLASKDALDVSSLADYSSNPNFASSNMGQSQFAQTLSIIVQPKPQQSWVTDTALFEIVDATSSSNSSVPSDAGTIDFRSNPSGADVYVFGNFVGNTPLSLNVKEGNYLVEMKLAGVKIFDNVVRVAAGQTSVVEANAVASTPATANLNIGSSPSGAEVYVDGQYVGTSPLTISVAEGGHDIEIRLPGYLSFSHSIYAEAGQTVVINPVLEYDNVGQASFESDPMGAEVYVDGSYMGNTPLGPISLQEGTYTATFKYAGYPDEARSFSVSRGQLSTVRVNFSNLNTNQTIIDDFIGLSLFPGATIVYEEPNKHGTYLEFEVDSSLETIMEDLNSQLFLNGWQRVRNTPKHKRIEAKYERDDVELYIDLRKTGSDEFSLDIYY